MATPLKIAIAQIAPVYLDRVRTVEKIASWVAKAAGQGAKIVAFGESVCPGYPAWLDRTDGAKFESERQKEWFARYAEAAVTIEDGDLEQIQDVAAQHGVHVVLGVTERPRDRGGHTLYCSAVVIGDRGGIRSCHRKLVPTYEERLVWGNGDGNGIVTHRLGDFTFGVLNCWENWMPLARAAMHAQGCDLHFAIWPGAQRLTQEITRFIALEGRSFVVSASGLLRESDVPADVPDRDLFVPNEGERLYDGGSAIAAPDGSWILEPVVGEETLEIVELDPGAVTRARQNLDISGHYSRPDVLSLEVDRTRQSSSGFFDPYDL